MRRAEELSARRIGLGDPLAAENALRSPLEQLGSAQLGDERLPDSSNPHDCVVGRVVDHVLTVVGGRGNESAGDDDSAVLVVRVETLAVVAQGRPDVDGSRIVVVDAAVLGSERQARRELLAPSIGLDQPCRQVLLTVGHLCQDFVAGGDDLDARLLDLGLLAEVEDLDGQGILHCSSSLVLSDGAPMFSPP